MFVGLVVTIVEFVPPAIEIYFSIQVPATLKRQLGQLLRSTSK